MILPSHDNFKFQFKIFFLSFTNKEVKTKTWPIYPPPPSILLGLKYQSRRLFCIRTYSKMTNINTLFLLLNICMMYVNGEVLEYSCTVHLLLYTFHKTISLVVSDRNHTNIKVLYFRFRTKNLSLKKDIYCKIQFTGQKRYND